MTKNLFFIKEISCLLISALHLSVSHFLLSFSTLLDKLLLFIAGWLYASGPEAKMDHWKNNMRKELELQEWMNGGKGNYLSATQGKHFLIYVMFTFFQTCRRNIAEISVLYDVHLCWSCRLFRKMLEGTFHGNPEGVKEREKSAKLKGNLGFCSLNLRIT